MPLEALGAFLSGAGAVISSIIAIRTLRKRMRAECDERVEEVKQAMREGFQMGEHHDR